MYFVVLCLYCLSNTLVQSCIPVKVGTAGTHISVCTVLEVANVISLYWRVQRLYPCTENCRNHIPAQVSTEDRYLYILDIPVPVGTEDISLYRWVQMIYPCTDG